MPKCWKSGRQGRRPSWPSEQGLSSTAKAKKEGICPVEARSRDIGGIQRCCLPLRKGRGNLCSQSSVGIEADQNCEGQKKFFRIHK